MPAVTWEQRAEDLEPATERCSECGDELAFEESVRIGRCIFCSRSAASKSESK